MMQHLLNSQKAAAQQASQARASTRQGIVTSYDPNAYAIKVTLQPDNVLTGWIPLKSAWVGNSWGLFCPPSIGDAVEVDFQEDDGGVGSAGLRFFNDSDRPLACPSGEFWLVHKTGAFYKLTNDGKALINGQVEIDATAPTINITATGNITAQAGGNAVVQAAGTATIQAPSIIFKNAGSALKKLCTDTFMALFNNHTHTSSASGTQTSAPTQQASAGTHTTNIVQAE
jgi:hypothetical protein